MDAAETSNTRVRLGGTSSALQLLGPEFGHSLEPERCCQQTALLLADITATLEAAGHQLHGMTLGGTSIALLLQAHLHCVQTMLLCGFVEEEVHHTVHAIAQMGVYEDILGACTL